MARLLKQSEAKKLGLPGRTSLEPVSGAIGSQVTFRIAELAVPKPGDPPRGPHLHDGFEECIYVLKGTGTTVAESGEIPIKPGDIVLIPPNEKHMTRNTGTEPLVLLCFFAEPDVTQGHHRVQELLKASPASPPPTSLHPESLHHVQPRSLSSPRRRFLARRCDRAGEPAGRVSRADRCGGAGADQHRATRW